MQLLRVIRVCHRHVLQKNFTPEIKKKVVCDAAQLLSSPDGEVWSLLLSFQHLLLANIKTP